MMVLLLGNFVCISKLGYDPRGFNISMMSDYYYFRTGLNKAFGMALFGWITTDTPFQGSTACMQLIGCFLCGCT
jgi:hypothetical protein